MTDEETQRFTTALNTACEALDIAISTEQIALCARHAALVLETNAHTNLTRITEPEAMAVKHYADSLTAFLALPKLSRGASVCDVGTGAGYPGVPMKILRPDLQLTLLDSLNKRILFLEKTCKELELENVTCRHARAEDVVDTRFDIVAARAVAALPKLLPWITRLLKPGGRLMLLKGPDMETELAEAAPIARKLGLQLSEARKVTLPDPERSGRTLVVYLSGR